MVDSNIVIVLAHMMYSLDAYAYEFGPNDRRVFDNFKVEIKIHTVYVPWTVLFSPCAVTTYLSFGLYFIDFKITWTRLFPPLHNYH